MIEQELEHRYKKLASNAVLFCLWFFCLFRITVELLDGNTRAAAIFAATAIVGTVMFLFLNKMKSNLVSFVIPFMIYVAYMGASFAVDSFKYFYGFYLLTLTVGAAYFNKKNFLAFIVVTQVINFILSICVLENHVKGNVWVHYVLILGSSLMLLMVVRFAVGKSNEVNDAFTSFGALMRITPSVLILIDKDNKIRYLSYSFHKIFNIKSTESFIGKDFLDLFSENSVRELFREIAQKRAFYENYQKVRIDGQIKTFDVVADKMSEGIEESMFFMLNDVSEIVRLKELAEQESLMDGLMQIPNRRAFDRQILQEWSRALRERVNLSFLMIDIDFFKKYNDTYGHRQGDELLKTAGDVFRKSLKRTTDFIARLGGEEFGVLLYATNSYQANIIAEKIRKNVESEIIVMPNGEQTKFTVSIGICTMIPHIDLKLTSIVEEADKALYKAKQNGRNRVWIAD
jgi:diguanylate cyclase (GGDEF)-like protein/PAS domain S-box-containing protein